MRNWQNSNKTLAVDEKNREGAFCARRPSACLAVWYGGGELRWADGGERVHLHCSTCPVYL